MLSPRDLDKFKRRLRGWYSRGVGGTSISINSAVEIFMWCALANDPERLCMNIASNRAAVYIAYESKLWKPCSHVLAVDVGIDKESIAFEPHPGGFSQQWGCSFAGMFIRAVEFGELPCEDYSSCDLCVREKVRDFRLIARASFGEGGHHIEPLRLTLEAF